MGIEIFHELAWWSSQSINLRLVCQITYKVLGQPHQKGSHRWSWHLETGFKVFLAIWPAISRRRACPVISLINPDLKIALATLTVYCSIKYLTSRRNNSSPDYSRLCDDKGDIEHLVYHVDPIHINSFVKDMSWLSKP